MTQTPSPAPAAGVAPVVVLPSDGDPANAASVAQALKVPADFIGHIMASSRPELAVVNAAASGFTTPTLLAFGGTVTASGSAHIADGTRFVVQIQAGGAVGVATFKTSMDGGATYGATQTTAASMTDATSGITLAFAGTFTASGTAAFRSAFTPLAQWRDAAGNGRMLIDHNGYFGGKRFEFREDWIANLPTLLSSALPITTLQRWQATIAGGASTGIGEAGATAYPMPMLFLNTTPTSGSSVKVYTACRVVVPIAYSSVVWEIDVFISSTSGTWDLLCGLGNATTQYTLFGFGSGNANVLCKASSGAAAPDVNTGVTVASLVGTLARLRIEIHGTASPYGSPARAFYFLNDVLVGVITTNLPTGGLNIYFELTQQGTSTAGTNVTLSGTTLVHNRYPSSPAL